VRPAAQPELPRQSLPELRHRHTRAGRQEPISSVNASRLNSNFERMYNNDDGKKLQLRAEQGAQVEEVLRLRCAP
jgi:hypothetical protein